ncbi:hypothetical protein SAMN04488498_12227 [Mesorhizobium albiziae]|uniref:Uncharacterized protein n=1 Tax=Neomesorhizobium albiziae TaxID=335020 RepID=A0A1I4E583_9HYPH|nr:hypothetical protein [Mesorhizobium albiziae]GLS32514.1 hypothetical protein GCM10007937_42240 [Mesorhizobium albiziae]SFL00100.1 hypothetical protein SAMN04488498_12227 [Mesorhizobium albiziae]
MKSKPLSNEHAVRRHPAQDGARLEAPGEDFAGRMTDEAHRCARELSASAPFEKDGKAMPVGAGAEALAAVMNKRFGEMAPTVTAWCAMLAWSEGTDASYRMWTDVFKTVRAAR